MDLTFRQPGPWGAGKGANLDAVEVDDNFWSLAQAIVDLQNDPAQPNGIANIAVSGTQMTITLHDGTVLGPYTLPVLSFRWRGEWTPLTAYAELDTFTVFNTGIFMTLLGHTSGTMFDASIAVGGEPALQQLFGSTDASLNGLSDVELSDPGPNNGDVLLWDDDAWVNIHLGTLGLQDHSNVYITGGQITGMPPPVNASDVVNKAYVDALPGGMSVANATMMSNIAGIAGPALPNTLTNFLDYVLGTTVRGTLLYRSGTGWVALAPGTSGQFLKTLGAGADPAWAVGGSGVTSVAAGAGITTGAGPITATGSVALATVSDNSLLANASGTSAAPTPTTLTLFLDHVVGNTRGAVLTRGGGGWVALAPGVPGYFLKTQGSTADAMWDAPAGSGTVTSVAAGTGISTGGSPITGAGTVSLAAIANNSMLANISGGSAAPLPTTTTVLFDTVFGATQGAVLYRNATAWVMLAPGTSGQILTSGGAAANISWAAAPAGASVANLRLVSNISGSTAAPIGNTLSDIFDAILGSSRGMLVYRGSTGWAALSPGTSGEVLTTAGAAGDPHWAGGGSSISVGDTAPAGPASGDAWWDSVGGQLYIRYNDGTSSQWVPASNQPGPPGTSIPLPVAIASGGTGSTTAAAALTALGAAPLNAPVFTGDARAVTPATADNDTSIATTAYVQAQGYATSASVSTADNLRVLKAGDTMGGALTVNANVSAFNYQIGQSLATDAGTVGFLNANGPALVFTGTAAAGTGQLVFVAPIGASITMDQTGKVFFEHEVRLSAGSQITPATDNNCYCGSPSLAFFQNNSHNYATISDPEQKTDIAPIPDGALAQVVGLAPQTYRWREGADARLHMGFMADQVRETFGSDFGGVVEDGGRAVGVQYDDLTAVLWRAVQELAAKVAVLEASVT